MFHVGDLIKFNKEFEKTNLLKNWQGIVTEVVDEHLIKADWFNERYSKEIFPAEYTDSSLELVTPPVKMEDLF